LKESFHQKNHQNQNIHELPNGLNEIRQGSGRSEYIIGFSVIATRLDVDICDGLTLCSQEGSGSVWWVGPGQTINCSLSTPEINFVVGISP